MGGTVFKKLVLPYVLGMARLPFKHFTKGTIHVGGVVLHRKPVKCAPSYILLGFIHEHHWFKTDIWLRHHALRA